MGSGSIETLVGEWEGYLRVPGAELEIMVRFLRDPADSDAAAGADPVATMDIPAQMAYRLPLSEVSASSLASGATIHFELATQGPSLVFDGILLVPADGPPAISGTFEQGPASGTIELTRAAAPEGGTAGDATNAGAQPVPGTETDVSVVSDGVTLRGTCLMPPVDEAPLVIIVAGSGPTDRDGNTPLRAGRNDSLRQLAWALGREGIATLRYDKRGVGASVAPGMREEEMLFTDVVNDLLAWVAWADGQPDVGRIYVAGHSEGGLVVMAALGVEPGTPLAYGSIDAGLAAQAQGAVSGAILLAAPGRPFDDILREQLKAQLGEGSPLYAATVEILAALRSGEPAPEAPQELAAVFRPSVLPYLRSIIQFDPAALIGSMHQPALIVGGTEDLQVPARDAELLAAASPGAAPVIVPGMNHVLKIVPEGDQAANVESYSDPSYPLSDTLVRFIVLSVTPITE
jgi:pimeloyl-ACP methyl ester carboxylesterase